MIKKLINWMKASNRWKHLLLGMAIGAASNDAYCAGLAGSCTAGAMEVKDKLHGGLFDWVDFGLTIAGAAVGYLGRSLLCMM